MAHTPGYWTLREFDEEGQVGYNLMSPDRTMLATIGPTFYEDTEANAHLMVAAPELLEASQALVAELKAARIAPLSLPKLEAAIAKAKGA